MPVITLPSSFNGSIRDLASLLQSSPTISPEDMWGPFTKLLRGWFPEEKHFYEIVDNCNGSWDLVVGRLEKLLGKKRIAKKRIAKKRVLYVHFWPHKSLERDCMRNCADAHMRRRLSHAACSASPQ